jgi:hypothetical protein
MRNLVSLFIYGLFASLASAEEIQPFASILSNGSWGWSEGNGTCDKNPHTIRFSEDQTLMYYNWRHTHKEVTYNILYADKRSFTSIIKGEERHTESGDKVIWQLNVIDRNTYCWRRTDWPSHACTPNIVQCLGES